jgi:trehalose-6-phosphate synthase
VTLIQIAAPSRENVGSYEDIRREVQRLVGEVNGRHTTLAGVVPIRFLAQAFTQTELASLYRAVDAMVVTPLQDGMNLVAKEFVAARNDNDGVLVLSEFAGAAAQLQRALLVNPYDLDGTARAMALALDLAPAERAARMADLRRVVLAESTARWATRQLDLCRATVSAHGADPEGSRSTSTSTSGPHTRAGAGADDADAGVAAANDKSVREVVARALA